MKKNSDYIILIAGGIVFLAAIRIYQGQRNISFLATVLFAFFYILWASYHHSKEDILRFRNVVEYVFVGLTILIFASAIFLF